MTRRYGGSADSPKSTSLLQRSPREHAMPAVDAENSVKKRYTTPELKVHGTLTDLTLMRFNWHPRRPGNWADDPINNVS
jgi:hypothetical protein